MATDRMSIRLHLKRMKVVSLVTDEINEFVIEVGTQRASEAAEATSSLRGGR